jgi:hypothetical protein
MMKNVHFVKTRKYMGQVKEARRRWRSEKRIVYCENAAWTRDAPG